VFSVRWTRRRDKYCMRDEGGWEQTTGVGENICALERGTDTWGL
jgi:hypothetical protein